jgi:hypothetical protein
MTFEELIKRGNDTECGVCGSSAVWSDATGAWFCKHCQTMSWKCEGEYALALCPCPTCDRMANIPIDSVPWDVGGKP